MSSTHDDLHKSRVQAEETPEESDASDSGGFLSSFRSRLAGWRSSAKEAYDAASPRRKQLWMLGAIFSLVGFIALGGWGLWSGYGLVARYLEAEASAKPAAVKEVREPSGPAELAKAQREAQQALEEAERERQLNVARMEADKYQWETWRQTLKDTEENKKRLAEKQRIADEQAAEEARLAAIEAQKEEKERQRMIAAKAPEARAAARQKKRTRTFE